MHSRQRVMPAARLMTLLSLVALVTMTSLSFAGEEIDRIERTFSARQRPVIAIRNSDGRVTVRATPAAEVRVVAIKEAVPGASTQDARNYASQIQIRIEQAGSRVEIEAKYPRSSGLWNNGPIVLVHFEVTGPAGSDLEAHTSDGPLVLDGFSGNFDLTASDGKLTATGCSGRLVSRVSDGETQIEGFQGEVEAHSSDGHMTIEGSFKGLNVKTSDGNVDISVRPGSTVEKSWTIGSSDGNIRMKLPNGFPANLDIRTSDGSIRVDHPLTITEGKIADHHILGKLNGGGGLISLRSSDGSVSITK